MKTKEEIEAKIKELEEAIEKIEGEFEEALEDEDVDELSERGEELEIEFETKKEMLEKQIKILEWVL